jgi:hypothetical protein
MVDPADLFLRPLGLVALLSVVPLLVLYLVRPEPTRLRLPTVEFLRREETGTDRPAFRRLRRNLLLLVQVLVLVLLVLALAAPYVTTLGTAGVEETAVVLDTSASMTATDAGGGSRFDRAVGLARGSFVPTTSLVTTAPTPRVRLGRGGEADAVDTLGSVAVTEATGDLAGAISQATAVAGDGARIVVVSDFAGDPAWRAAVATARARGYTVRLRAVGGRLDNVGIVGAEFDRTSVTVSVRNYADEELDRTVSLGDRRERLTLAPGDVGRATFPVPAGNSVVELSPGDPFTVDDRLPIAGPDRASIRVLVLTNGEDRFLVTALSVLEEVDLTVARPPTTVSEGYDVVVFSNVAPDRLLASTRETVEETVRDDVREHQIRDGGGVVVAAQPDLGRVPYGPLLPVTVNGTGQNPSVQSRGDTLTEGIRFPPPDRYLRAELEPGASAALRANDSPLLARGRLGEGRTLYYGYLPSASEFGFTYQYPVFVKRLVYEAAGREPLPATNLPAGSTLSVPNDTRVAGPDGERAAGGAVRLDRVGVYRVGDRRYGVSLSSETESNVSASGPTADTRPGDLDGATGVTEERLRRPLDLSPLAALGALVAVFCELAVLRRRGDI